jgi:DNA-3-methyladenine glycosylase
MTTELRDALALGALEAAPLMLGVLIVGDGPDGRVAARITEVEAYREDDPASHSFRGPTPRTIPMFGEPGRWYVYFTYGMHWCANVTCGPTGRGEALLVRAAMAVDGLDTIRARRGRVGSRVATGALLDGPAKVASAFRLTGADSGAEAWAPGGSAWLVDDGTRLPLDRVTPRVGIRVAVARPWRFCAPDAPARFPAERRVRGGVGGAR